MTKFTHLHLHTQYSILDGAASISKLMEKAKKDKMEAMAITDHGNMFGVLDFVKQANENEIKPIIGCETYVAARGLKTKEGKEDRSGFHLILLAKNKKGYHNLSKLISISYKDGFYFKPRVDIELLKEYHEGIIASTACLGGEVPQALMRKSKDYAKEVIKKYKDIFGDDFYLELMRHGRKEQKEVNEQLIELSKELDIPLIATNDVHYVEKEDYEAHHILICINTGKDIDSKDSIEYTGNEYFRTTEEMKELFADVPEAIENTQKVVDKIENINLEHKIILPHFQFPENFKDQDEYLKHLSFEGAKIKYKEVTEEVIERLNFELEIIKDMGFAGYFLIVQDLINEARKMDVIVGPGRGSAAGSAVAFCTGITDIDPIKYNLLFERFLNPERISMPDIDIDFDDYGRDKVLQYVVDKYGEDKVAQIITFGTMAPRLAIRDVARVLKLPLPDADRLAKLVPNEAGITLEKAFKNVNELKNIYKKGKEKERKTLEFAKILEGSKRHTGTHACGVIIGPDDLKEHIPLSIAKDSDLMVTQYEGKLVENVGMLKMDFLGLKTLTIIKDTLDTIKRNYNKSINIEEIDLNDKKTFELYQKGLTLGTFQFESPGMRKHLQQLKPDNIEDLIAMNALYRPGPMKFIPQFIRRKHGSEKVEYPHPSLEKILAPTFGIMVYQEQIMQCAQIIGNFSLGKADVLRRAMGKKKKKEMDENKTPFIQGAKENNISKEIASEIFTIMEGFAEYGFNRSHSAAYSVVAYYTAYLKANYPAAYMAAVLAHNMSDIKKVNILINECNNMGISVLGPDINESQYIFTVSKEKIIRYGLGGIKGVGEAAVNSILIERNKNSLFKDIFDLTSRVNLRAVNKRSIESLALAGAFDSFENTHRAQYFHKQDNDLQTPIDKAIKLGQKIKASKQSAQQSLFGDEEFTKISNPSLPKCDKWPAITLLQKEKELIGFYISGHPLDENEIELKNFCNVELEDIKNNIEKIKTRNFILGGIVDESTQKTSKKGTQYGIFTLEDYTEKHQFYLFNEKYMKFKYVLEPGAKILIQGTIRPKFRDSQELVTDIKEITLLNNAMNKLLKKITLKVDLESINKDFNNELEKISKEHKGDFPVYLEIITPTEDKKSMKLLMSSKIKVDASKEFFEKINKLNVVKYKLN